jgi:erythronate-4-phosphate dehydrogenase
MKIIADENIPAVREAFSALGEVRTVNGRNLSADDVSDADILLVRSVTRVDEALLAGSRVRFVASATAGVNHIDLDYLQSAGIQFAHAPGSNAISAAEYVIAAICYWALEKDVCLPGLSIGIVGYGNVGKRVAQRCERLGMRCVINDPPLAEQGVKGLRSLEEALACDIVTLHVPLVTSGPYPTLKLINAGRIAAMRPGTLFINAARGEVVEEMSLLDRVKGSGDLTAVLDVWENEPDIDPVMLENTLLGTAHIAGYSADGKIRGTEMIYQACCEFLAVQPVWSSADVTFEKPRITVSLSTDPEVRQQVLDAYDIETDSARLKAILAVPDAEIGQYFDYLRKHYPVRREFTGES